MDTNLNYDEMTVAEIVTKNIRTADIFKKNGIDFCCGGNVLARDICQRKKIDFEQIKRDITQLDQPNSRENYDAWALDFLVDYIVNMHHRYVSQSNELISEYAEKVAKVHGHHYTEVVEINRLFQEVSRELNTHMHKEEMVLFPYVKRLVLAKRNNSTPALPPFGTIMNPIRMMEADHDVAGDILKKIEELSHGFTPPEGACNTFRALYASLKAYQDDLYRHVHLENNILFPKAVRLEEELLS